MQGFTYEVDIALVIDVTGSMHGILDEVKSNALRFHEDLTAAMRAKDKQIDSLRVRVVAFRDYYADGDQSMETSDFFELPAQQPAYADFVSALVPTGGGDEPENGLEALVLAMRSDWTKAGSKRRQVIIVWTDASAHPLEKNKGAKPSVYPSGMPADFDALTDLWEGQDLMDLAAKRLIIYAPDAYAWTDMGLHWDNAVHYTSKAGRGLSDVDYGTIIDTIAQSV
ncbi:vWA domain-containing protein [Actinacidiphila sp. ITFR-21]|uniref:vWA domain-containing protein n=1 Tax=Actinacidiphila sp. ITFR-21 TaxID=3075199 RepID=UPI00288A7AC9|nr:vWA domain-containing protein [Streptomyces sp. ITFR-21]WNI16114.1 vWA domain-containing protein [Streptomyces sp. ITFR-21]